MEYDYREETIADESAEEDRVKAYYEAQGYTFINKVFPKPSVIPSWPEVIPCQHPHAQRNS